MSQFDVIGIGNAIVDVISTSSDMFLDQMGIEKGIMQLVERERAELARLGQTRKPIVRPGVQCRIQRVGQPLDAQSRRGHWLERSHWGTGPTLTIKGVGLGSRI